MFKRTLLMCAVSLIISKQGNAAETVEFDSDTLKSLGISPALSDYFAERSRFMPGKTTVSLNVNGVDKGNTVAEFNQRGELCFNKEFMEHAALRIPDGYTEGCYDYLNQYPTTVLKLIPGQEKIELVVSASEIESQEIKPTDFITDGTGGLLNYSLLTSRYEFAGEHSDYAQAQLDGGINFSSWLLRTQQLLSKSDGRVNRDNGQTYLQRTFLDLRTTARMGDVNTNNALLEGTGLYGVTFTPENALVPSDSNVKVTGLANTPQARVEVRQQGVLVYSTLVPAGPFTLTHLPLRNSTSDLNVTVIETDGTQRSYILPASLYLQRIGSPAGLYVSVGRVSDHYDNKPVVVSASGGWRILPESNAVLGMIAAKDFQAAGIGLDTLPWSSTLLSFKVNQSYDHTHSLQGQSYRTDISLGMPEGMGITASTAYYTSGYREFSQFVDKSFTATKKREHSVGLQWQTPFLGGFNATFVETYNRDRAGKIRYVTTGWGRKFYSAYITANWQRQLNSSQGDQKNEDVFYLNVSFPLGKSNGSTYARRDSGKTRFGSRVNGHLTEDTAYNLGTELGRENSERSFAAGLSSNLHYSQLTLNGGVAGNQQRNYSASLQGGIVAHSEGVTFSPLPVNETFGIVSMAQPVAGIKMDTPAGPTWTDARGYAVIPSANAWHKSRIEVNTGTLPKNMDISNGTRYLSQGRGSVSKVQFNAITQRRVLLNVAMANGAELPKNSVITSEDGNYLTTAVDDGVVFISNASASQVLMARTDNGACRIELTLPKQAEPDVFYETAKGVCL